MDPNSKSKYSHWKPTTNPTHNTNTTKHHQNFNLRYDPHRYSSKTRLQSSGNNNISTTTKPSITTRSSSTNKYTVDFDRLLHDGKSKKSSSSNAQTISSIPIPSSTTTTHATSSTTRPSSLLSNNHNITTRYKSTHASSRPPHTSSVPLSHHTTHNMHSNKHIMDYRTKNTTHNINRRTEDATHTHNEIKEDMLEDRSLTDKLKSFKLTNNSNTNSNQNPNNNKFILSSKSNNMLLNTRDNNNAIASKPHIPIATRSTDTQNNLSLIRPNDRVVLYSPIAHCYVCLSDFEHDMDTMYDEEEEYNTLYDNKDCDGKELENESDALYLQCDDMEGVAMLIGETQFCGTCKFLADCKIQLITGQGLYKDRDRIIIHSKHTTKFMLQNYDHLGDTGSMSIGHRVLIFVEASRCNAKLFWSYCSETQSIILKECENKPSQNEIFVLQKYGQPLEWRRQGDDQAELIDKDRDRDGHILDKFFSGARGGDNISVQEFYLCHDILRVLSRHDFNGDFIYFIRDAVYGFPRIVFNGGKYGISPLLQSAVDGLLTCIEDTAKVRHFVSIHCRAEYGVVSQAFCFEIESHLRDFNILLVQLETRLNRNELTLQNLRFYLQRACRTMNALRRICCDIHLNKEKKMKGDHNKQNLYVGSRGGALLNMIQKHINISGERHVVILYNKLLKAAQKPYFNMLSSWIYRGVITDIYSEFMIKEKRHLKKEDLCCEYNNEYWTGRYSLNTVQIPFILSDYCDIIVTTGKYLNVMRESKFPFCNKNEKTNLDECSATQLGEYIADQYNFASKALLGMLMNRERIMDRFASISKYMLLECGDWFCYFMDMAQSILLCPAADIKKTKLDRLLELSFRTSNSSRNDPFKDDVCCDIKNSDLNTMIMMLHDIRDDKYDENTNPNANSNALMRLSGIEAFALSYKVQWPASIIFTGRNLIRYQLIFRFLFKLKFVSRQLAASWKSQMSFRELNLHHTHNACLMLRHQMLSFMDSLLFYISYQVIEPNWNRFIHSTQNTIKTVDSLLSAQEVFLTHTLQECLLTHKESIQLLFKILCAAQQYSNFIKRYTSDYQNIFNSQAHGCGDSNEKRKTAIEMCAKDCRSNLSQTNFINSINKYKNEFDQSVQSFLRNLQQNNQLKNQKVNVLLSKLDYNAYYMPKLLAV
eukprot:28230_1